MAPPLEGKGFNKIHHKTVNICAIVVFVEFVRIFRFCIFLFYSLLVAQYLVNWYSFANYLENELGPEATSFFFFLILESDFNCLSDFPFSPFIEVVLHLIISSDHNHVSEIILGFVLLLSWAFAIQSGRERRTPEDRFLKHSRTTFQGQTLRLFLRPLLRPEWENFKIWCSIKRFIYFEILKIHALQCTHELTLPLKWKHIQSMYTNCLRMSVSLAANSFACRIQEICIHKNSVLFKFYHN